MMDKTTEQNNNNLVHQRKRFENKDRQAREHSCHYQDAVVAEQGVK